MTQADCICAILRSIYVVNAKAMREAAKARGITVEQLAAAAIDEWLWREGNCQQQQRDA